VQNPARILRRNLQHSIRGKSRVDFDGCFGEQPQLCRVMPELILSASRFYFRLMHAKNGAETLRETFRRKRVFRQIIRCAGLHQLDCGLLVA
jgi:hypothetical protein